MVRRIAASLSVSLAFAMAPALAQNNAAPQPAPPAQTTPPATTTPPSPPAGTTPPPVIAIPPSEAPPAPEPVETAPAPEPASPELVTISPDAAYPNGFADPEDPFGNDLSLARTDEGGGGFPWGLLGLLGLFGLVPLFRKGGHTTRTVYVDRDDPKRVIREVVEE